MKPLPPLLSALACNLKLTVLKRRHHFGMTVNVEECLVNQQLTVQLVQQTLTVPLILQNNINFNYEKYN